MDVVRSMLSPMSSSLAGATSRRRRRALVAAVLLGLGLIGPSLATSAARPRCPTPDKVLAEGRLARIYVLDGVHYGCVFHVGRPWQFEATGGGDNGEALGFASVEGPFVVAGEFATARVEEIPLTNDGCGLTVYDLRRHRDVRSVSLCLTDLALSGRRGFVAAITDRFSEPAVFVFDRGPNYAGRIVSQGAGVEPGSLAFAGDSVTWKQGGTRRSAPVGSR